MAQSGSIISRSTVQRVTNLEKEKEEIKEIFTEYDEEIHRKLKCENRGYEGFKPDSKDWVDLFEEDEDFAEELNKILNDSTVTEADLNNDQKQSIYLDNNNISPELEHTPEVFQDTYLNM